MSLHLRGHKACLTTGSLTTGIEIILNDHARALAASYFVAALCDVHGERV